MIRDDPSVLQVDPENYLGLEPSPGGRDTGGGVVLGAPPLLAGWPLHHLPHLPGKHVDSLLQRYQASKLFVYNSSLLYLGTVPLSRILIFLPSLQTSQTSGSETFSLIPDPDPDSDPDPDFW